MSDAVVIMRGIRVPINIVEAALYFAPHREHYPDFRATLMCVPNIVGSVHEFRHLYPWLCFGIAGWEGSSMEMKGYTEEQIAYYLDRAIEFGYDPVIQPPNYIWDQELIAAAKDWTIIHMPTQKPAGFGPLFFPGPEEKALPVGVAVGDFALLDKQHALTLEHMKERGYDKFYWPDDFAVESWPTATDVAERMEESDGHQ